jgi:hypothetical protein
MLSQLLSQQILSTLSIAYPSIVTDVQDGSITHQLDADTIIHIHGMKQLQKGKTYILVQVMKSTDVYLNKSRSFYIDETNPSSIKPKLKFLLSKKGW